MGIKHMATRIVFTFPKQSVKQWIHESELLLSLWSTSGIFELENNLTIKMAMVHTRESGLFLSRAAYLH